MFEYEFKSMFEYEFSHGFLMYAFYMHSLKSTLNKPISDKKMHFCACFSLIDVFIHIIPLEESC